MRTFTPQEVLKIIDTVHDRVCGMYYTNNFQPKLSEDDWHNIKMLAREVMSDIIKTEMEANICKETQNMIDSTEIIVEDIAKIIEDIDNRAE